VLRRRSAASFDATRAMRSSITRGLHSGTSLPSICTHRQSVVGRPLPVDSSGNLASPTGNDAGQARCRNWATRWQWWAVWLPAMVSFAGEAGQLLRRRWSGGWRFAIAPRANMLIVATDVQSVMRGRGAGDLDRPLLGPMASRLRASNHRRVNSIRASHQSFVGRQRHRRRELVSVLQSRRQSAQPRNRQKASVFKSYLGGIGG